MKNIDNHAELENILKKNTYVFVDFYTPTCPPCKIVAPYLEELEEQYPLVTFVKVDCTKNFETTEEYRVSAVPTFILISNGKKVHTLYGSNQSDILDGIKKFFPE